MARPVNDLKVNGSMRLSGGVYDAAVVNGALEINGRLECADLKVNGMLSVNGNLKAGSAVINGKLEVEGSVDAARLDTRGKTEIEGGAKIGEIRVEGALDVEGAVEAEKIDIRGHFMSEKGCNAEEFHSIGRFKVEGLLNAEKIKCELYGKSYAEEIGGMEITITEGQGLNKWLKNIFPGFDMLNGKLIAGSIEGDVVKVEYTEAGIVRGTDVYIGEGCDIMLVEYKREFKAAPGSRIKESRKI